MSIVDSTGARASVAPKKDHAAADRVSRDPILRRNDRWLRVQRTLEMSVRETARFLSQRYETVRDGIAAAEAREARAQVHAAAAEAAAEGLAGVEVVAGTGLTLDDLVYLQEEYPSGTRIGDHPDARAFFARHNIEQLTRDEIAARRRRARLERDEIVGAA